MGLDLSLSATGVVVYDGTKPLRKFVIPTSNNTNQKLGARLTPSGNFIGNEDERVDYIAGKIFKTYKRFRPTLVAIEGPAYSKHERGQIGRYELQGVVKWRLRQREALFYTPSPSELKLWLTGDGRADKDAMIAAAREHGCMTTNENVADAFAAALHAWDRGLGLLEPA